jgi:predicted transcriptional regulator
MTKLRDEYTAKMHTELDALNARMNALEARAHEVQADVREQYHRELAKLHEQSLLASAKLESIKRSGEDTWDKMVLDMNNVRNALLKSFDYFKAQL